MSLDIYLIDKTESTNCSLCNKKIDDKDYQYCPWCGREFNYIVHSQNITHNVNKMWMKAGCYDAIYNSNGKKAKEIIPDLKKAIKDMGDYPSRYKKLDAPNGWGTYVNAYPWLKEFYIYCVQYPEATIGVSK